TQGLAKAQQPEVIDPQRTQDAPALTQAREARRRIRRQEVFARGRLESEQHRGGPKPHGVLPETRNQRLVTEVDPIVGADGQGVARAVPAEARYPPNQLHAWTHDIWLNSLIHFTNFIVT